MSGEEFQPTLTIHQNSPRISIQLKATKLLLPLHAGFRNSFEKEERNAVNARRSPSTILESARRGRRDREGYFIGGCPSHSPLKRFRLPIPDFWRSQHYRKLSWSTCTPDRKQITAGNAFSSRPRQRWPMKLATSFGARALSNKTSERRRKEREREREREEETGREKGKGENGERKVNEGCKNRRQRRRWLPRGTSITLFRVI